MPDIGAKTTRFGTTTDPMTIEAVRKPLILLAAEPLPII
jgi:hypothetical protein